MKSTIILLLIFFSMSFSMVFVQHDLPTQTSTLFSGSGNCAVCHGPSSQGSNVLTDPAGDDISPVSLWRSTMMASAARDPLWQAKVSAEVLVYPALKEFIEDKCITCHSPTGRTEALFQGQAAYSMDEMNTDPLAMDGVTCTVCHQIDPANLGTDESFSGKYVIAHNQTIYGPFENPFLGPMAMVSGYTPSYGAHMSESTLCATCHTLFTPTLDVSGNVIGQIGEQTPYLEWLNSTYPGDEIECQGCHMPYLDDPVVITSIPPGMIGREPFARHYFVGANTFMLKLLRANSEALGVTATTEQIDSTLARTYRLLQEESAELSASWSWTDTDTLQIEIVVGNMTGHKFPTAIPLRRAWLYVEVLQESGSSVFVSGAYDPGTGVITELDEPYETHRDVIRRTDQVQVYQALMQDENEDLTYTFLQGLTYIKDNRIPPEGYTDSGPHASETAIAGMATQDPNFNRNTAGAQGTGEDIVYYRIGGVDSSESYTVKISLLYQSLTPRFVEDLFQYDTPEVDAFRTYYEQTDKSAVVIDSLLLSISETGTGIESDALELPKGVQLKLHSYPNPFQTQVRLDVSTEEAGTISVSIFDLSGRLVIRLSSERVAAGSHTYTWNGVNSSGELVTNGQYILKVEHVSENGSTTVTESKMVAFIR